MFGANAGSVYAATKPGFDASQAMTAQSVGIAAGTQQLESNNELNVGNYNASLAALEGHQTRESQAEGFNGAGVLLEGSPLATLEQTRQLSVNKIANINNQALLQAKMSNTQSNQTINQGRAQMLGLTDNFIQGQANADIEQQNVLPNLVSTVFSLGTAGIKTGTALKQWFST